MKIKLDENLGNRGVHFFRLAGHDVATVADEGLFSASDKELLEICLKEKRCLVTLDLEFGNPLIFNPKKYPGIAILRLPPKPTPDDLFQAIKTLIGGLTKKEITGKLWIIQRGKMREYQPENQD